jgi:quinoprotein glucose dehydrogenase
VPCTPPPWGTLLGLQASTGEKKWEVPLGQLSPNLPEKWGSISLGGPMVTAGALVFIAGTLDPAIRAFDAESGNSCGKAHYPPAPAPPR